MEGYQCDIVIGNMNAAGIISLDQISIDVHAVGNLRDREFFSLAHTLPGAGQTKTGHLFSAGYNIVHGPAIRYLHSQGTLRTSTPPIFAHSKNETQLRSVFVYLDRPLPSVMPDQVDQGQYSLGKRRWPCKMGANQDQFGILPQCSAALAI